ncbi:MAG TPA: hypothetical protein VFV83_02680 [Chthoniobacteraceae bacterium]|nr:hypothetical protein [Chthoniobacteraceae bacterium]
MNSLLPGSAILRSAAVFMLGLAATVAGGLLMWPEREAAIGLTEHRAEHERRSGHPVTFARSHEAFADLADALAETDRMRRAEALRTIAFAVTANDVPAALDLAAQVGDGAGKTDFLSAVFVKWAEREPAQALAHALTCSEVRLRIATVSGALQTWAASEPRAALNWLEDNLNRTAALAPPKVALQAALDAWATTEIFGIEKWIVALPPGESRDRARILLGEAQIEGHPAAAMRITEAISDPASREATFIKLYRLWVAHDSAAANTWLNQSAPPQLRARIVKR